MSVLLRFDHVALRRGGRLLFEGMSFALAPGDALQLSGPNGSGKSSLIRLVAGLLRAERGEIERGSVALADDHLALDPELPLRRALGFWGGTVEAAMDTAGIAHLAEVPVRYFSSGQLKRATLARVAASGAALWLLDEPLNALDQDGASRLDAMIDTHRRNGGAVLAASHQALPGEWRSIGLGA
jgi:heme exporter protein A